MSHPGDHDSFGPARDRDAFGTGHGAAADRDGVICDGSCQPFGEGGVVGGKARNVTTRPKKPSTY